VKRSLLTGGGLALALLLFLALNVLANTGLRSARADLTENRLYTLSPGTKNILAGLDEDITLRFFFSRTLAQDLPGVKAYAQRVQELLEEYAAEAGGRLELVVLEPEPFSEVEDQAVSCGLRGERANAAGDLLFFGLSATNTTDDSETIPFFHESREEFLEYDLTRLVHRLSDPELPVIGLLTQLPLSGMPQLDPVTRQPRMLPGWVIAEQVKQLFELRTVPWTSESIDDEIDVLMIVHPKDLPQETLFAVDQFVLRGGRALVFLDPFCEADRPLQDPQNPMAAMGAKRCSDLGPLLSAWGVSMATDDVAADRARALRVGIQGQGMDYVVWLGLRGDKGDFSEEDAVTAELKTVNVASAGCLYRVEGSTTEFEPLTTTSSDSMKVKSASLQFQEMAPDPGSLLDSFVPEGEELVLAARIRGPVKSAFPDGKPADPAAPEEEQQEEPAAEEPAVLSESQGPINVIVVSDVDLLQDRFWVQVQDFLGTRLVQPMADNGSLVVNALENLTGSDDLISLRSRGRFQRPFDRVVELRREAEARFRQKEQEFEDSLRDTEQRISEILQGSGSADGGAIALTPELREELDRLRDEKVRTRKGLRETRHQLNKDIERLGTRLKLVNVLGIPLLVAGVGLAAFGVRAGRRKG
jgi:ABC-type uncharacterized transport system involved in gliding motility auxiliary subunit